MQVSLMLVVDMSESTDSEIIENADAALEDPE